VADLLSHDETCHHILGFRQFKEAGVSVARVKSEVSFHLSSNLMFMMVCTNVVLPQRLGNLNLISSHAIPLLSFKKIKGSTVDRTMTEESV